MSNMLTYSGRRFNPENPNRTQISITDIAHGLAMNPRFNGQLEKFYSVAEHSVLVAEMLAYKRESLRVQLLGLFHDAEEAYTGDIPSPIKTLLKPAITEVAEPIKRAIYSRLRQRSPTQKEKEVIKWADHISFALEDRHLRGGTIDFDQYLNSKGVPTVFVDQCRRLPIEPVGPKYAKIKFFEKYLQLVEKIDVDM